MDRPYWHLRVLESFFSSTGRIFDFLGYHINVSLFAPRVATWPSEEWSNTCSFFQRVRTNTTRASKWLTTSFATKITTSAGKRHRIQQQLPPPCGLCTQCDGIRGEEWLDAIRCVVDVLEEIWICGLLCGYQGLSAFVDHCSSYHRYRDRDQELIMQLSNNYATPVSRSPETFYSLMQVW